MQKLRDYIVGQGLKDYEFAKLAGIHRVVLSRVLNGQTPSAETARRIVSASHGEVSFDDLFKVA